MRMNKILAVMIAGVLMCFALTACGGDKAASGASSEADASSTVSVNDENLTEFPSDCKLSEDEMRAVVTAYADYMTEALKSDGYVVEVRFEDDGSVHYDGTRTDAEGNTDTVKDLASYSTVKDAFSYLYNCGQVDLEGNLLVGVSEGVQEAVEEATSEAESIAESELDAAEEGAESTESTESAPAESEASSASVAAESAADSATSASATE